MGEALTFFRAELEAQGHTMRGAKQFGTILALAHVMLFDGPIDHETDNGWAEQLKYEDLAAWADDTSDEQAFLEHISTTAVDPHRGGTRRMLGEWIGQATGFGDDQLQLANVTLPETGTYIVWVIKTVSDSYSMEISCTPSPG